MYQICIIKRPTFITPVLLRYTTTGFIFDRTFIVKTARKALIIIGSESALTLIDIR